jgi:hypothetical protein
VLHSFSLTDGAGPSGLVFDAAGNLYGTTTAGGDINLCVPIVVENPGCGVVFKLTHTSTAWTETVLHAFRDLPARIPEAPVLFDAAGNLYGTTSSGSNNFGVVFKIAP